MNNIYLLTRLVYRQVSFSMKIDKGELSFVLALIVLIVYLSLISVLHNVMVH